MIAAMIISLSSGLAAAATIDINVSDVTFTNANIVITPSEDAGTYYYGLMSADDFRLNNGADGIVDKCISDWETMGSWYSKTWIEMLPSVLYTDSQSFTGKEFKIRWDSEYVVYAFGMDSQTGEVTIPVVSKNFTTPPAEHSDNTFTISIDKVTPTEGSTLYMDVTVTVTPSNDDPYAVLVQQSSILDFYDGSDEEKSITSYFAKQFVNYVTETYTGKQTLTFTRQKKGKDMYVVVAGFNGAPSTDLYKRAFRTEETPIEPEDNIAVEVTDITRREATVKYMPSNNDIHYFRSVLKKTKFFDENNGVEGIYDFDKSWFEFMASMTTDKTWDQVFYEACVSGESTETASYLFGTDKGLEWGTDFVAYAYGINEAGEIITPVSYVEFSTPQRNNNTDLTFDLSVVDVTKKEGKNTYTARINVIPSTSDTYATHYHSVEFYDWYIDNPDYTWEDYLFTQFDKYIYKTYIGENVFECPNIKPGEECYFVVTGYDDAPNTEIFKIKFTGEEFTEVTDITDSQVSIDINNGTLTVNGIFDFGCIYTIDGKTVASFRSDKPAIALPAGTYVVDIVRNGTRNVEKVVVK